MILSTTLNVMPSFMVCAGYSSFLGYYNAMTEDYWAHTHGTGQSAPGGCKGDGLGGLWNGLANNTGQRLGHSLDNGTYESTLFGDRAVDIIEARTEPSSQPPSQLAPSSTLRHSHPHHYRGKD